MTTPQPKLADQVARLSGKQADTEAEQAAADWRRYAEYLHRADVPKPGDSKAVAALLPKLGKSEADFLADLTQLAAYRKAAGQADQLPALHAAEAAQWRDVKDAKVALEAETTRLTDRVKAAQGELGKSERRTQRATDAKTDVDRLAQELKDGGLWHYAEPAGDDTEDTEN